MKIKLIIGLLIIIILTGCTQNGDMSLYKNPDLKGRIIAVNEEEKKITFWAEDGAILTLKATRETQFMEKNTGTRLNLNDINFKYRADAWITRKGDEFIANHINAYKISRSEIISKKTSDEEGKYCFYIYSKDKDMHKQDEVQTITYDKPYKELWDRMGFYRSGGLDKKMYDIKEDPTILVFDHEDIVLRTNDYKELLEFFKKKSNEKNLPM